MTQDNKIELLLHILTHLDQYIKYYNPNTFRDDIKELGYDIKNENGLIYYPYEAFEKFVLKNQPLIEQRYIRKNFMNWYENGVSRRDPKLNTPAKYEMVLRDINVIKQEILILYFFKNWELDKNIHIIDTESDFLKKKQSLLYEMTDDLGFYRDTTAFIYEGFDDYVNLAKFKEDKDCQIVAAALAATPNELVDGIFHTLIILTTREPMKLVDRPFMFLHYTFDCNTGNTIKGLITSEIEADRTNDNSDTEYNDFYTEYEEVLKFLLTASLYVTYDEIQEVNHMTQINPSYKHASVDNIKNRYREIEINYIK